VSGLNGVAKLLFIVGEVVFNGIDFDVKFSVDLDAGHSRSRETSTLKNCDNPREIVNDTSLGASWLRFI